MKFNPKKSRLILFWLMCAAVLFELIRDSFRRGDFIGYVNAGRLVLQQGNIYSDPLNTWPPFFSVFSVLFAVLDSYSSFLTRFLFLSGSMAALLAVVNMTLKLAFNKNLSFKISEESDSSISLVNPLVLVPTIIMFRFIISNLANIQINMYMLFFAMASLYCYSKKKNWAAALFLALGISLKVYIIFLLPYFLYKRAFKTVFWTFFFLVIFNSIPFSVFGFRQAADYYHTWHSNMLSPFASVGYKNQSLFSFMRSLLTKESPGLGIYTNIFNFQLETVRLISYSVVGIAGVYLMLLFSGAAKNRTGLKQLLEYSIVLTLIPLLSPLAWKAYFIFLWVPYFMLYYFLFNQKNILLKHMNKRKINFLKIFFVVSVLLNVFTVEGLVGRYISDLAEVYSCITVGAIILLLLQVIIYRNTDRLCIKA